MRNMQIAEYEIHTRYMSGAAENEKNRLGVATAAILCSLLLYCHCLTQRKR